MFHCSVIYNILTIGNLFYNFIRYILGILSEQLNTLKIQNKKKDENVALSIFCPTCRNKHALREFPLDSIELCVICTKNHDTREFPSISGLKVVFQEEVGTSQPESLCFVSKRPWKNQ